MLQSEKISSLRGLVTIVLLLLNINILSCKQPAVKEVNKISEPQSQIKENDSSAYVVELVADNLFVPWSIVFTAPERMLFTERNGSLRIIKDGKLIAKPLKVFEEVSSKGEEGLMGLALDPDYKNNKYIYLSYAYPEDDELKVKDSQIYRQ
ncbi:MAG: PQQ-dependent sugar dehydrogenase [Ignavibacteria bacterium]|nr:PQQ-dependent sugar dehydrogenase [Ignavibacteria bacterium]